MINRTAKGYRREKLVIDAYKAKGYLYYKPPKVPYGDMDVFNLFDILVYHPKTFDMRFISVKSTYAPKEHKKELANFTPRRLSIELVEYRGKRKGNEKVTVLHTTDIASETGYDEEIELATDEHPIVIEDSI